MVKGGRELRWQSRSLKKGAVDVFGSRVNADLTFSMVLTFCTNSNKVDIEKVGIFTWPGTGYNLYRVPVPTPGRYPGT